MKYEFRFSSIRDGPHWVYATRKCGCVRKVTLNKRTWLSAREDKETCEMVYLIQSKMPLAKEGVVDTCIECTFY